MALCIDVSRVLVTIIHLIIMSHYMFSIFYDLKYVVLPENEASVIARPGFGGRSRYLTYWCLVSF